MNIHFDNIHELMLLHKAIMESKFPDDPTLTDLYGSPYLSSVSNKVVEKFIELSSVDLTYGSKKAWETWRVLKPDRKEWKIILKILRKSELDKLNKEQKTNYLQHLISPFVISEIDFKKLLEKLNA
jgi:hypothetical protein